MAINSRVNPNFPLPGIDQSSKGFRDNFTIIKTEIEALQGKSIQLVGDISSVPTVLDGGTTPTVIVTTSKVYRKSFTNSEVSGGEIVVTHNLGNKIVMVQVSDDSDNVIAPDQIKLLNSTQVQIVLGSFVPLTGLWNVIVRG